MDRFPPAKDGPQFELSSIGRALADMTAEERTAPSGDGVRVLIFTGLALLVLLLFVGWLLVG